MDRALELVRPGSEDLAQYDPEKGLKAVAVAETAERYFRRAKDASKLLEAVELKLTEQRRKEERPSTKKIHPVKCAQCGQRLPHRGAGCQGQTFHYYGPRLGRFAAHFDRIGLITAPVHLRADLATEAPR